jgi:thioredoxin-like negative regulator of GroEL
MEQNLDAEVLNEAGRMSMVEGYRATPHGSPSSEYFKRAEERFRKAHELDPSNPRYALNMADALFALGKLDEANKYYWEAAPKMRAGSNHLAGVKRRWGVYVRSDATKDISDKINPTPTPPNDSEDDGTNWNFHPQNIRTG